MTSTATQTATQSETHDIFLVGLRNAHAMEKQALSILRPQAARIEKYPAMAARIEQHISETEGQVARLDRLLESQGTDNSTLKDMAASVSGSMAALGHSMAGDEILKNTFANYAFENFEIAAYRSLITLGEAMGHGAAVTALQQSLLEEEAMADWILDNIEAVTLQFAGLREAGVSAKR